MDRQTTNLLDYESPQELQGKSAPKALQTLLYPVCLLAWVGGIVLVPVGLVVLILSAFTFGHGERSIDTGFALMVLGSAIAMFLGSKRLARFLQSGW